jgi:hypothetical protein
LRVLNPTLCDRLCNVNVSVMYQINRLMLGKPLKV